jgi:hypothetical protein
MSRCLACMLLVVFLGGGVATATERWLSHRDPDFGFSFSYPSELFVPAESDRRSFHYFASPNVDAKFLAGAWDNRNGATPMEFKRWMIANAEGYEDITYQPHGRSWFVVSGYRGDQIYYEKLMFSCGGKVASVLAISYPANQRDRFDPVVERMEDTFTPARAC